MALPRGWLARIPDREATSRRKFMPTESLIECVKQLLAVFCLDPRFSISGSDDQTNPFGAWVRLESDESFVDVIRDRGQEWIMVTAKTHPRPRAPRRGWPLGHVLAYLEAPQIHTRFLTSRPRRDCCSSVAARSLIPLCSIRTDSIVGRSRLRGDDLASNTEAQEWNRARTLVSAMRSRFHLHSSVRHFA